MDATTVGRRLANAERALGTRLFTRTPDGLRPTAAGLRALTAAEQAGEAVLALEREVAGGDERAEGTVRITSGDGVLYTRSPPRYPSSSIVTPRCGSSSSRRVGPSISHTARRT